MDGKGSRRTNLLGRRHRRTSRRNYGRTIAKFLKTQKQSLLTSVLLIGIVVLLFGVFSRLQAPPTNTTPTGVTVMDYSAFVGQVQAGNMLGVMLQGDEVNGLLTHPLSTDLPGTPLPSARTTTSPATTTASKNADLAAWEQYVTGSNSNSLWTNTSTATSTIDATRAVYTRLPTGGDSSFIPLLQAQQVAFKVLPVKQPSVWQGLFWRFAPFIVLLVLAILILVPRNKSRSGAGSLRTMDERVTQMSKSRVRRFERAKEGSKTQLSAQKPKPTSTSMMALTPKQPVKMRVSLAPPVTFADVAGIDEVRAELEEIVEFLRSPERFKRLGARIPRGALLVGPPGTGKTLLAKAVAGEAGVPFFCMSASEFVEMFVGVGASRVRDLFNQARQASPCVIFLDELDAVGRKRTMRVSSNDERDQTLNQLLVELDGFDERQSVVVLAATNRVDILDKALLRPGRFDRHITVSLPDRVGRQAILVVHTRTVPLHEEVSLERIARMTTGMSGADLANLVNEAALSAARQDLQQVTHECFEQALIRVQLGALRPLVISETERRIIAIHEGGHALVAYHLPEADTVNRVTILPRGQSLGVTQFTAEEDRYNYSRQTLMARIAVGLGGRVAEELTFGSDRVTTGAENDFQVVTGLARRMVTRWGMSEQVGVVFADYQAEATTSLNMRRIDPSTLPLAAYSRSLIADVDGRLRLDGVDSPTLAHQYAFAVSLPATRSTSSTSMAATIDAEVQRILSEGRAIAQTLLREHRDQLLKLADTLIEQEQLNRAEFEELLEK